LVTARLAAAPAVGGRLTRIRTGRPVQAMEQSGRGRFEVD